MEDAFSTGKKGVTIGRDVWTEKYLEGVADGGKGCTISG